MNLSLQPGSIVFYQGAKLKIRALLDLETFIVENVETNQQLRITLDDLIKDNSANNESEPAIKGSIAKYTTSEWDAAYRIFKLIEPALRSPSNGKIIDDIVKRSRKSRATIYRWINKYSMSGQSVSALIDSRGQGNKGNKKIDPVIEEIIGQGIEQIYMKKGERKKKKKVIEYVQLKCRTLGIKAPHSNTIRNRIDELDEYLVEEARFGKKAAKQKYYPNLGTTPYDDYPLSVVQIDHTNLDIILVDPVYREPIGRPWLTIATDLPTRMFIGYYLSFDAPSYLSVGMCLINAILPKNKLLKSLGIEGYWPCWGVMSTISLDNAKEFHSESLERACQMHKINIDWRPIRTPHYGGNVESLNKTFNTEIHNLPGTTFSNTKERGDYESEKKAALTFQEFEKWLLTFIVNIYHQRKHSTIKMSPLTAWSNGIVGTDEKVGIGYQDLPDESRISIDFLPLFYRTIQEYGVAFESINYYSDVLKKWVHRRDRSTGKAKLALKHEFRWDPRDMSQIYFYDDELDQYFRIPYRNLAYPSISIWELRAIKKKLKERGEKNIDEVTIFKAMEEMNRIEEGAISEKAKVKRARTRARKENSKRENDVKSPSPRKTSTEDIFDELDLNSLEAFN